MITKKRVLGAVLALVLAFVGVAAFARSASAHVPHGGFDCVKGVWAQGDRYNPEETNTLRVRVDNDVDTKTFGANGFLSKAIPQDGQQHTVSWEVDTSNENPNFHASGGGTIQCGDAPPPPPEVKKTRVHVNVVDRCSCRHDRAWMTHTRHVSVVKSHPKRNKFVFHVTADPGYKVHVPGTPGFHKTGKVVKVTGKRPCPCKRTHTCHKEHPHAQPGPSCRGRCS